MSPHCAALDRRYLFEGNLTGPIPESIGALTNLHDLQVLSNSLGGTIPAAIGNLTALTNLVLVGTSLSGSIPEAISRLKQLRSLELNDNRLSGTIPACITHLTALTSLYLDHNQLTGELPSFHHMPHLSLPYSIHAQNNYLTATPDPSNTSSVCLFHHNCLGGHLIFCGRGEQQRRASECRAFCGAQPLTPPCSGRGVCSFQPDPSHNMAACEDEDDDKPPPRYCEPEGQCVCDEGYTPGTKAGTCVSHGTPAAECAH
ncbi:unnamed protein product [Closterium sp. NIES-64]|nr:unnamed protein product [Closterium sp. NIES-64]